MHDTFALGDAFEASGDQFRSREPATIYQP